MIIPILVVLISVGLALDDSGEPSQGSEPAVAATTTPSAPSGASGASSGASGTSSGESGAPSAASEVGKTKPKIEFTPGVEPHGLEKTDLVVGTGPEATPGTEVTVHYIVFLNKNGKEIESSWGKQPYSFQLGSGEVSAGWERGIAGMKVGGRRELVAPSQLAFGKAGVQGVIGPNEDLRYVIDLLGVKSP